MSNFVLTEEARKALNLYKRRAKLASDSDAIIQMVKELKTMGETLTGIYSDAVEVNRLLTELSQISAGVIQ